MVKCVFVSIIIVKYDYQLFIVSVQLVEWGPWIDWDRFNGLIPYIRSCWLSVLETSRFHATQFMPGSPVKPLTTSPLLKYFQFHLIYSFPVCSLQSANIIHSLFKPWLFFTLALSMYCLQLYACTYSTHELNSQLNLRICSCLTCVYRVMEARGKFGEHERCVRVARGDSRVQL